MKKIIYGMSIEEAVKKFKVSRFHLYLILQGKRRPSAKLALKISKETGIPIETILFPNIRQRRAS